MAAVAFVEAAGGYLQQLHQIGGLLAIGEGAFVGQRQLVQIVHQLAENADFALQRGDRLWRQLAHPVLHRLQLAAQDRQRRAQLVGDIGHKGAPHTLVFFQRAGEAVKILRQLAQFILAADLNARREIAGGQMVRPCDQPFYRRQQTS